VFGIQIKMFINSNLIFLFGVWTVICIRVKKKRLFIYYVCDMLKKQQSYVEKNRVRVIKAVTPVRIRGFTLIL